MNESAGDRSDPAALEGLTILVSDDEPDVRLGIRRLLAATGAEIVEAADGNRALAAIRARRPDLVISDIRMPGLSGVEVIEALREDERPPAFLFITGFGTIELAVRCMSAGAAHFMAKPFDNKEMMRIVTGIGRRLLAQRSDTRNDSEFIARDPEMLELVERLEQVAVTRLPVLIEGETGTGKELVARQIHTRSARSAMPFLAVNCAALPDTLLESELFGHRAGAFTGATTDNEGLFVAAAGGTVFLDEVASMSPTFQGKLLRVLQEKVVRPLGTREERPVDFRLIAATNRDLAAMVGAGSFRDDLLYRLKVLGLVIPPLRRRPLDIVALAEHFCAALTPDCRGPGAVPPRLTPTALELLGRHSWPGNVRELQGVMSRALIASRGNAIEAHHLDLGPDEGTPASYEDAKRAAIERFQRRFVESALAATGGNISQAAVFAGMTRAALQRIMRALAIDRECFEK